MHDIGKIGIPDHILLKPGRLEPEEWEIMKTHAQVGADILAGDNSDLMVMAQQIARTHHEKWDGSGYPQGKKGEDIPLSARILALADVYDALTSSRCYKDAFSHVHSKDIIIEGRGKHFDPDIVDAFLRCEQAFIDIRKRFQDE